jgi:hypothetical protein
MVKKEDAPHTVTYNDKLTKFSLSIPITLESNAVVSKIKKVIPCRRYSMLIPLN